METILTRYRNLTVLLIVVVAQLLFLAYQVRTNSDDRLIRVWAVSAVTPMAGIVEAVRHNTTGFLHDYFILLDVREQNRKLKSENDKLRMDNIYYRNQISTAEHARVLTLFQEQSPSKTVAARVIGNSTVATAKAVFIDRGSTSGVQKGMAVVTPDGIVGKVVAVYPLVAQVLLVTDATFKVGVESQKNHIHGVLDCGSGHCVVEQIQAEDKLDMGEWFYTSGEDRVFPRGFPVGTVTSLGLGQGMRDVKIALTGAPGGAEEVLVVLDGVHQEIPAGPSPSENTTSKSLPPPPDEKANQGNSAEQVQTEADKIVQKYEAVGKDEGHVYGAIGSNVPNFNVKPVPPPAPAPVAAASNNTAAVPTVLGAPPKPAAKPAPAKPEVELPLGAPRRKAPTSTEQAPPPQQ